MLCNSYLTLLFQVSQTCDVLDILRYAFPSSLAYRDDGFFKCHHFSSPSRNPSLPVRRVLNTKWNTLYKCRLQQFQHCNKSMIEPFGIERNKFVFSSLLILISFTTAAQFFWDSSSHCCCCCYFSAISNYVSFSFRATTVHGMEFRNVSVPANRREVANNFQRET